METLAINEIALSRLEELLKFLGYTASQKYYTQFDLQVTVPGQGRIVLKDKTYLVQDNIPVVECKTFEETLMNLGFSELGGYIPDVIHRYDDYDYFITLEPKIYRKSKTRYVGV